MYISHSFPDYIPTAQQALREALLDDSWTRRSSHSVATSSSDQHEPQTPEATATTTSEATDSATAAYDHFRSTSSDSIHASDIGGVALARHSQQQGGLRQRLRLPAPLFPSSSASSELTARSHAGLGRLETGNRDSNRRNVAASFAEGFPNPPWRPPRASDFAARLRAISAGSTTYTSRATSNTPMAAVSEQDRGRSNLQTRGDLSLDPENSSVGDEVGASGEEREGVPIDAATGARQNIGSSESVSVTWTPFASRMLSSSSTVYSQSLLASRLQSIRSDLHEATADSRAPFQPGEDVTSPGLSSGNRPLSVTSESQSSAAASVTSSCVTRSEADSSVRRVSVVASSSGGSTTDTITSASRQSITPSSTDTATSSSSSALPLETSPGLRPRLYMCLSRRRCRNGSGRNWPVDRPTLLGRHRCRLASRKCILGTCTSLDHRQCDSSNSTELSQRPYPAQPRNYSGRVMRARGGPQGAHGRPNRLLSMMEEDVQQALDQVRARRLDISETLHDLGNLRRELEQQRPSAPPPGARDNSSSSSTNMQTSKTDTDKDHENDTKKPTKDSESSSGRPTTPNNQEMAAVHDETPHNIANPPQTDNTGQINSGSPSEASSQSNGDPQQSLQDHSNVSTTCSSDNVTGASALQSHLTSATSLQSSSSYLTPVMTPSLHRLPPVIRSHGSRDSSNPEATLHAIGNYSVEIERRVHQLDQRISEIQSRLQHHLASLQGSRGKNSGSASSTSLPIRSDSARQRYERLRNGLEDLRNRYSRFQQQRDERATQRAALTGNQT